VASKTEPAPRRRGARRPRHRGEQRPRTQDESPARERPRPSLPLRRDATQPSIRTATWTIWTVRRAAPSC